MPEGFVQLPEDGAGKKVRAYTSTLGPDTVYHQTTVPVDVAGNEVGAYTSIVDEVSSTLLYAGVASPGSSTSYPAWRIKRVEVAGSVTSITWAGGVTTFSNVWDNRSSLVYS